LKAQAELLMMEMLPISGSIWGNREIHALFAVTVLTRVKLLQLLLNIDLNHMLSHAAELERTT